jgi:iron(III) transport system permease protein
MQRLTGWQLPGLEGGFGVALQLGLQGVPLAWLTVTAALQGSHTNVLERAARACGASPIRSVLSITLPLLWPALGASAGLVYIASASDFGIPAVLGIPGRFPTVTTQIYQNLSFSASEASFLQALVLAAALAVLAAVVLLAIGRVAVSRPVLRVDAAGSSVSIHDAWGWITAAAMLVYILFTAALPFVALLLVALTRAYGQDPLPSNWTLAHFGDVLGGKAGAAFGRSVVLAAVSALVLALIGTAMAVLSRLRRWGSTLDALVALPFSIPGSTLAIGVILAFSRFWYGTLNIILVAYLARFWSLAERPAVAAIAQVGPDPVRAARVSGAGPRSAWWTGVWPSTRTAVFVGAALVFLAAFHELTVSSLLYAPGTETVAVIVLNAELAGDVASTAAVGVLLTVIVLAVAIPIATIGHATRATSSG